MKVSKIAKQKQLLEASLCTKKKKEKRNTIELQKNNTLMRTDKKVKYIFNLMCM